MLHHKWIHLTLGLLFHYEGYSYENLEHIEVLLFVTIDFGRGQINPSTAHTGNSNET